MKLKILDLPKKNLNPPDGMPMDFFYPTDDRKSMTDIRIKIMIT